METPLLAEMHDLDVTTDFTNIASVSAENNGLKTISVVIMQQQGGVMWSFYGDACGVLAP